jgi:hypothetical protein
MREKALPRLRFLLRLAAPWLLFGCAAPGLTPATGAFAARTVVCEFCPPRAQEILATALDHCAVAGGPLVTRFVYDPSRHRLYGVQGQLFVPGDSKRTFLFELETLLRTFRLEKNS